MNHSLLTAVRRCALATAGLLLTLGCNNHATAPLEPPPAADEPAPAASLEPQVEGTDQPAQTHAPAATSVAEALVEHSPERDPPESSFEDWPKPQLALFITGQQHGYIEPCGCTGLENQKGGLARRHTLARQLADKGWPLLPIDAGNQVRRWGPQAEIKFQVTIEGLKTIGYQAVALGVDDLRLSAGHLLATTVSEEQAGPFISANASVLELTPGYRVVEAGGMKVGIAAVVGGDLQAEIGSDEIVTSLPEEGLDRVLPELRQANCDLYVLLANGSVDEAKRLARKYADFRIVVAGGGDDPTYRPETIAETGAMLVQTGIKSTYVVVVGVMDDPQQPFRYQRVALDARLADSRVMLDLLGSYQEQLRSAGFERLGLQPIPHPDGAQFVGSEKCGECHTTAYAIWKETPHAQATRSLVEPGERSEIPRHYDPECLSCHVTGWHPQRFFPYLSGYLSLEQTPLMVGNGCENCHGPGSRHVAAHAGEIDVSDEELDKLTAAMRLPLERAELKCLECHDLDNDPHFQEPGAFEEYWELIKHYGLD